MITTLSPELTTPVPAALARKLNLRPGSQLDWNADVDGLTIHVKVCEPNRTELLRQVRELGSKHKREGEGAVADLIRERELDDAIREHVLA